MDLNEACEAGRQYEGESTFRSGDSRPRLVNILHPVISTLHSPAFPRSILHFAISTLHSRNPYCTAIFCTVPRNELFSFSHFGISVPSRKSTISCPEASPLQRSILHSELFTLHSQNPYCTAVFCTVPRIQIFSLVHISPACSFMAFVTFVVPSSGPITAS